METIVGQDWYEGTDRVFYAVLFTFMAAMLIPILFFGAVCFSARHEVPAPVKWLGTALGGGAIALLAFGQIGGSASLLSSHYDVATWYAADTGEPGDYGGSVALFVLTLIAVFLSLIVAGVTGFIFRKGEDSEAFVVPLNWALGVFSFLEVIILLTTIIINIDMSNRRQELQALPNVEFSDDMFDEMLWSTLALGVAVPLEFFAVAFCFWSTWPFHPVENFDDYYYPYGYYYDEEEQE